MKKQIIVFCAVAGMATLSFAASDIKGLEAAKSTAEKDFVGLVKKHEKEKNIKAVYDSTEKKIKCKETIEEWKKKKNSNDTLLFASEEIQNIEAIYGLFVQANGALEMAKKKEQKVPASVKSDTTPTPKPAKAPTSDPSNSDPVPTPVTPAPTKPAPTPTEPAKDFAKDLVAANGQITALKNEIAALNQETESLSAEFINGTKISENKDTLIKELGDACKFDDCKEVVASDPASEQNVTDANAVVTQLTEKKERASKALEKLKAAVALSKIQDGLNTVGDSVGSLDKAKALRDKAVMEEVGTVEDVITLAKGCVVELQSDSEKAFVLNAIQAVEGNPLLLSSRTPNPIESRLTRKNGFIATFVVAVLYELYSGFTAMKSMNRIARAGGKERVGFLTALGKTMSGQARSVKNFVVDLFASEENDDE